MTLQDFLQLVLFLVADFLICSACQYNVIHYVQDTAVHTALAVGGNQDIDFLSITCWCRPHQAEQSKLLTLAFKALHNLAPSWLSSLMCYLMGPVALSYGHDPFPNKPQTRKVLCLRLAIPSDENAIPSLCQWDSCSLLTHTAKCSGPGNNPRDACTSNANLRNG